MADRGSGREGAKISVETPFPEVSPRFRDPRQDGSLILLVGDMYPQRPCHRDIRPPPFYARQPASSRARPGGDISVEEVGWRYISPAIEAGPHRAPRSRGLGIESDASTADKVLDKVLDEVCCREAAPPKRSLGEGLVHLPSCAALSLILLSTSIAFWHSCSL